MLSRSSTRAFAIRRGYTWLVPRRGYMPSPAVTVHIKPNSDVVPPQSTPAGSTINSEDDVDFFFENVKQKFEANLQKRQKEMSDRVAQLKSENEHFSLQVNNLQLALDEKVRSERQTNSHVEMLKSQKDEVTAELQKEKSDAAQIRAEVDKLQKEKQKLGDELVQASKLIEDKQKLGDELVQANKLLADKQNEIDDLEDNFSHQAVSLHNKIGSLEEMIKDKSRVIENLNKLRTERDESENELNERFINALQDIKDLEAKLQKEEENARKLTKEQAEANSEWENRVARFETIAKALSKQYQEASSKVGELIVKLSQAEREKKVFEGELKDLVMREKESSEKYNHEMEEHNQLKVNYKRLHEQSRDSLESITNKISTILQKKQVVEAELNSMTEERVKLNEAMETEKQKAIENERSLENLREERDAREEELRQLKEREAAMKQVVKEKEEEIKKLKQTEAEKDVEMKEWIQMADEKITTISELKHKIKSLSDKAQRVEKNELRLKELEDFYTTGVHEGVRKKIETLEIEKKQLESEKKQLETKLQQAKKKEAENGETEEGKEGESGFSWFGSGGKKMNKGAYEKKIKELTQEAEKMKADNMKLTQDIAEKEKRIKQMEEDNEEKEEEGDEWGEEFELEEGDEEREGVKMETEVLKDVEKGTGLLELREKALREALEKVYKIRNDYKRELERHLSEMDFEDQIVEKCAGYVRNDSAVTFNFGGSHLNVKKEVLEKYPSSYFNTLMSSQPTKRVCTVYETEKDEKEDLKYAEVIVKAMEGKEISFDHFESEPVLITQKLKDYNVQVPIVFSKSFDWPSDEDNIITTSFCGLKCTIQNTGNNYKLDFAENSELCYEIFISVESSGHIIPFSGMNSTLGEYMMIHGPPQELGSKFKLVISPQ